MHGDKHTFFYTYYVHKTHKRIRKNESIPPPSEQIDGQYKPQENKHKIINLDHRLRVLPNQTKPFIILAFQ